MITLAHHWLITERGGEKVLKSFSKLFPSADIYTIIAKKNRRGFIDWLGTHKIITSQLQNFPGAFKYYKFYLPLFPLVVSNLKVDRKVKVLLSSDASIIKGLNISKDTLHVCYCHSPPRYLWSMQGTYLKHASGIGILGRLIFRTVSPFIKNFDRKAALNVDHFIANSNFVAKRIRDTYKCESTVIYPPISVDQFRYSKIKEDFYLVVSEMVPYKRIDLVVDAFNQNGKRLVVIGDGSELKYLKSKAAKNIEFFGRQPFEVLRDAYSKCRAFILPGEEDFGITPLEAQASGSPVIAYAKGGALETVIDGKTGIFFTNQVAQELCSTIERFEKLSFLPEVCRKNAQRFSEERFRREILQFLRSHAVIK